HPAQVHVADDDFHLTAIESLQRGLRGGGPEDTESSLPQPSLEELADEGVVVDEEELAGQPPRRLGSCRGWRCRHSRLGLLPSTQWHRASHRQVGRGATVTPRAESQAFDLRDVVGIRGDSPLECYLACANILTAPGRSASRCCPRCWQW